MPRVISYLNVDMLDCFDCHSMGPGEWGRQLLAAIQSREQNHVMGHLRFKRPNLSPSLRAAVLARDGYTCVYCGAAGVEMHCDHVMPISRGGPDLMENLVTACARCNLAKHDRTPEEWLGE